MSWTLTISGKCMSVSQSVCFSWVWQKNFDKYTSRTNAQKFSTSGFWWIYKISDILNTISILLEKVYLSIYLCVCLRMFEKNFVVSVAQEQMHMISCNYIFSVILTQMGVYLILVKNAQQVTLKLYFFFQTFGDTLFSVSSR